MKLNIFVLQIKCSKNDIKPDLFLTGFNFGLLKFDKNCIVLFYWHIKLFLFFLEFLNELHTKKNKQQNLKQRFTW